MELSATQIDEFKEAFSLFDRDNDAQLTLEDFTNVINSLSLDLAKTPEKIKELFGNNNDKMNFELFLECMISLIKENTTNKELYEIAFSAFDKEENGKWDIRDFRDLLTNYGGTRFTSEEIEEMVMLADIDKDGYLSKAEFMRMVLPCD